MAQEYKLKDISSLADIKNMDKVESEVEGVEGGKVLVLRFNGQVHAMSPKCTHYGAPLKLGVVAPDGRITCPWHGGMLVLLRKLGRVHADHCGQPVSILAAVTWKMHLLPTH